MPPPRARSTSHLRDRFRLAQTLHQSGRLIDASAIYQDILRLDPRHADALHFLGLIALQMNQPQNGVRLIERSIALKPSAPEALGNLGIGYADLGRFQQALASFENALLLNPNAANIHDNRGTVLRDLGRHEEAVASHDRAIALRPSDAGAFSNRGNALRDLRRYEDALASYDRAISLQPDFLDARCNRAKLLQTMGRYDVALNGFDDIINRDPNHAEAHRGRGNVLRDMREPQDALISFDTAVARAPNSPLAHNDRGNALFDLRRYEEARASFARAITLQPNLAQAHNNHGNALQELQLFDAALESYTTAITLKPDYAEAFYNRGNTLVTTQRLQPALTDFDRAVALKPNDAMAHRARALTLATLRRYAEAIAGFEHAMRLDPATRWLPGDILFVKRRICDWRTDAADVAALEEQIRQGQPVASPFTVASMSDSPAIQQQAAEVFARIVYPPNRRLGPPPVRTERAKIHIAYVSADFRDHPMMDLMAGVFETHDKSRFEVTAFSLGPDTGDAQQHRVKQTFDRFVDVRSMPDEHIATLARTLQVDIAIDLTGFTMGFRTGLFSYRAAPVQVQYLGFPATMGTSYFDYVIADPMVIPPDMACHFNEHVVYLPHTYQANDRQRPIAGRAFSRAEQGLPSTGFVFCCFNNSYKITPDVFDSWMRILARTGDSVLWLYEDNPDATLNMRREAAIRDISPDRLVFAKRLPGPEHLARHRLADLALDTLPYNAHTTASDALWAGLPVLTRIGGTFAGRVAASLLHTVGLPDLITTTPEGYEARAIELATSPDQMHAIRTRLQASRLTTPLFDTERFTRTLEAAYQAMDSRIQAGLPAAPLQIPDSAADLRDATTTRR